MSDKVGIQYVQADKCLCGKSIVASYLVVGPDILSPRRYDKGAAQQLADAYNEIADLKEKLTNAESRERLSDSQLRNALSVIRPGDMVLDKLDAVTKHRDTLQAAWMDMLNAVHCSGDIVISYGGSWHRRIQELLENVKTHGLCSVKATSWMNDPQHKYCQDGHVCDVIDHSVDGQS